MHHISRMVRSHGYMLKLLWHQSKIVFFLRLLIALVNGITPTISVLLFKYFVEEITEANWKGALSYIALIIFANISSWLITNYISYQTTMQYTQVKSNIMKDLFSKTADMDIALLETPEVSTLREKTGPAIQKCEIVLDSFYSIISNLITVISTAAVLSSVQPIVFIVIA